MKNSISKSQEFEEMIQELGNQPDSIFSSMKDVMIFCALLALHKKQDRRPIGKKGGDSIKIEIFKEDFCIIDIIALFISNDLSILTEERLDEKLTIFEEYANAGVAYLKDRFNITPNAYEVRNIIDELRPEKEYSEPIDLSDLVMESVND